MAYRHPGICQSRREFYLMAKKPMMPMKGEKEEMPPKKMMGKGKGKKMVKKGK